MSVELSQVSYIYAEKTAYETPALQDVSVIIADGEFAGIMGKTGSGKSTFIQLIAGLLTPSAGKILVDGEDINDRAYDRKILRKKVGVVFQFPEKQLFASTVYQDVAFGLHNLGWDTAKIGPAVDKALTLMGFDPEKVKDESPFGFSGGEKRRLAIAGVLAAEPEILILDEPVAGLDPGGRTSFLSLLKEMNNNGTTIIMVSHNADVLAEVCDRIIAFEDGRVFRDLPTKMFFDDTTCLDAHGIGTGMVRRIAEELTKRDMKLPSGIVRYEDLLFQLIREEER